MPDRGIARVVRAYAVQGHLSAGTTVYGTRLWPRHEVNERRDNPPGQGKGGGRRAGEPQGPRKHHPYEGDPRLRTATDALTATASAPKSRIAAELAAQHGNTPPHLGTPPHHSRDPPAPHPQHPTQQQARNKTLKNNPTPQRYEKRRPGGHRWVWRHPDHRILGTIPAGAGSIR
ncbi:hypothetical protein GCM10027162_20940 [Streptomyces incanus]